MPLGDRELTAGWSINKYTITFVTDGTPVESITADYDSEIILPETVKEGYTFDGWYDGESKSSLTKIPEENKTLTAHWTPCVYTITFEAGSGELGGEEKTKQVTYGETYGSLIEPLMQEMTEFTGWYTDEECKQPVDSSTTVSTAKDHSLYAGYVSSKSLYDFADDEEVNAFKYPVSINTKLVDNDYIEITKEGTEDSFLKLETYYIKAGARVEVLIGYNGEHLSYEEGQFTFGLIESDKDGNQIADASSLYYGNAAWDGGWNGSIKKLTLDIKNDCYGIRMFFKFGADSDASYRIYAVRITKSTEEKTDDKITEYDFTDKFELYSLRNMSNTSIVLEGSNVKLSPVDTGDIQSKVNDPESYIYFENDNLVEGAVVYMDFEIKGTLNVSHGVWTWGVNDSDEVVFDGVCMTAWDAPGTWNNGVFTAKTKIKKDCTALRILLRYGNSDDTYWLLKGIRVNYEGEENVVSNIDHAVLEEITEGEEKYTKVTLDNKGVVADDAYALIWIEHEDLPSESEVEIDIEFVGDVLGTSRGVWVYEAGDNGSQSTFLMEYNGWTNAELWNSKSFTIKCTTTQNCQGLRVLLRFAGNVDAYYKIKSIRII